jgi:hypothetical protein
MRKKIKILSGAGSAILAMSLLAAGCSRYAPTAVVQKDKILEIVLTTSAPVAYGYYYYIAFDTKNPLTDEGPRAILYDGQRGENWSYYIRLHNGVFTESSLDNSGKIEIDETPIVFNYSSDRYYQANVSGNTITLRLYAANIPGVTVPHPIAVNFITSNDPLSSDIEEIVPLDYLVQPRVSISTSVGSYIDESTFPLSSSHTVDDPADIAADITSWSMQVYEK